jgi:hypothetical protein
MARTCTGSNFLKLEASQSPGDRGSICFRFKPNWTSGDNAQHCMWAYESVAGRSLGFFKTTDNLYLVGWYTGTGAYNPAEERRIISPDRPSIGGGDPTTAIFIADEEALWVYTWDVTLSEQTLWKDGVKINGRGFAPAGYATEYAPPFPSYVMDSLAVGNNLAGTLPADGPISEFGRFDYILSPDRMQDIVWEGIAGMSPGPAHWVPILGDDSPEPAEVGPDLIVVGTPAQAAHPTFSAPPPLTFDKPAAGTPIDYADPLTDGLKMAWVYNEGAGLPVELVGNNAPSSVVGTGYEWLEDGSFHQYNSAIVYPSADFSGATGLTICMLTSVDEAVTPFPFPNNSVGILLKGLLDPYTFPSPAANECAFFIGQQHADEVDGGAGGRDEFWAMIGDGPDNWYLFRVSGMPWSSRCFQVFFVFDGTAPAGQRWTCRINGIKRAPCQIYADADDLVVPTTSSDVVMGAGQYNGVEAREGKWKYLYIWEGARPDLWEPLLTEPYRFIAATESESAKKTINGLARASVKTINSLAVASMKTWGGVG